MKKHETTADSHVVTEIAVVNPTGETEMNKLNLIIGHVDSAILSLLQLYMPKIKKAMEANGNEISVTFSVNLKGVDPIESKVAIAFTPEKVKFDVTGQINFDQPCMFEREEVAGE